MAHENEHAAGVGYIAYALAVVAKAPHPAMIAGACALHDIGKVIVPPKILHKKGPLDPEDWVHIHGHPKAGAEMLRAPMGSILELAQSVALYHHERWDGTGYPLGLAGREIPYAARICSVADVWDALTNDRPYRAAMDRTDAWELMKAGKGTQFDPTLIDHFQKLYEWEEV